MTTTGKYGDPCVERHSILITDRGGTNPMFQPVDLSTIEWNRTLDLKSSAKVTISGRACRAQTSDLNKIEPRRHEMVIFRGTERVWEGPIINVETTSSLCTIDANDIFEYLDGTSLSRQWGTTTNGQIITERLRAIIEYELTTNYTVPTLVGDRTVTRWENIDTPANIIDFLDIRLGETTTKSVTEAFQMTVGEHIFDLGRDIGINYTTSGRSLVIWEGVLGRLRTVTEADFSGDFNVKSSGKDFWTSAHVISTQVEDGEDPRVGHAVGTQSYYGPWEQIISVQNEDSDASGPSVEALQKQARRAISGRYPVPVIIDAGNGSSLIPSKGITINQLIAGVQIPVRTKRNLKHLTQIQRLSSLKVQETAKGETISAKLAADGEVYAA